MRTRPSENGDCDKAVSPPTDATAHGRCSNPYDGFLPGVTLGLPGLDANGFVLDSWGTPSNRFRYAIADTVVGDVYHAFTRADGMKSATMAAIFSKDKLLSICSSATNPCAATTLLSNSAIAVIFSLGRNAASGVIGTDEAANLDGDTFFVSHPQTSAESPGGEFDDVVTWIGPSILFNRMIAAGKLP